jgi:hypothetical protein
LNSSTDVTLISPSANGYSTQGFIAEVKGLSIYNKDTSSVTVTVKTTDGTDRIKCKATLLSGETLGYANGEFFTITSSGAIKNNNGISSISSSTDNAVVRWDGAGGGTLNNSAFVVDDSGHVTSFGGQIVFPGTQAASAGANTLDDYEEGTWTPADGSGAALSLTVAYAAYTKIGRLMNIQCSVTYPVTADGNTATISGLPVANGTGNPSMMGNSSADSVIQGVLSASTILPRQVNNAGVTNATISGDQLWFNGAYIV